MNFKIGDRVKVISNEDHYRIPRYYPIAGTVGNVVAVYDGTLRVKWTAGTTGGDGRWSISKDSVTLANPTQKIVITQSDNRTIARLYDDNKVIKSAEAKCSPTDTYDFAIGAKLAFERLMPASEPKQAVVEEKKMIRVIDSGRHYPTHKDWINKNAREYMAKWENHYQPHNGDVAEVITTAPHGTNRKTLYLCKTSADDIFIISTDGVEPYTEPTTSKEPIARLYCFKSFQAGEWVTDQNIYEINSHGYIKFDDGTTSCLTYTLPEFMNRTVGWGKYLVPLVQRSAKVGEYILATQDSIFADRFKKGDILKCTSECEDCDTWKGKAVCYDNSVCVIENHQYLILDGYTPEPITDPLSNYEWVDGYKGFDADMKCRNYQYEIGKEYDLETEESMCNKGFHFCKTLEETRQYYTHNGTNRFCKVSGLVKKGEAYSGKYCARKIKVLEEVAQGWSGKVICTFGSGDCLTAGKIYAFVDGFGKFNDGEQFPNSERKGIRRINCFKDLNDWCREAQFIEYKGEAL